MSSAPGTGLKKKKKKELARCRRGKRKTRFPNAPEDSIFFMVIFLSFFIIIIIIIIFI